MQQEQYIHVDEDGNKFYYKDCSMKIRHRLDGPALEWVDWKNEWFIDGKRHRLNGPAIEWHDGGKEWYADGKLHRLNGPAFEHTNGSREWYVDGKRHRLDGPAIEWDDGSKEWFVDGKRITEEQFNAFTAPTLELTLEDIATKFGVDVKKVKIVK
jgi:hypothetical protein